MSTSTHFKLFINSPLKTIQVENTNSVQIDTNNGRYEFLSDHYNYATNTSMGECLIFTESKIETYTIFNGSIYFDNEQNILFIYCLDFWSTKQNITNFENILQIYKQSKVSTDKDSSQVSNFKLNFTKEYNICLDVDLD